MSAGRKALFYLSGYITMNLPKQNAHNQPFVDNKWGFFYQKIVQLRLMNFYSEFWCQHRSTYWIYCSIRIMNHLNPLIVHARQNLVSSNHIALTLYSSNSQICSNWLHFHLNIYIVWVEYCNSNQLCLKYTRVSQTNVSLILKAFNLPKPSLFSIYNVARFYDIPWT